MPDIAPDFNDVLNGTYVSNRITVGAGAEVLAAASGTNLAKREFLMFYNDGNKTIYFGPTGVTKNGATKGVPVEPTETVTFKASDAVNIYLISDTGNQNVIVQEWS